MALRILAYAQLLRLPNVFTAFADVLLAACAAGYVGQTPLWFLLPGSGALYLAGMVWNDIFDRHEDSQTRPTRPIPSRRVSLRTAIMIGTVLTVAGWLLMAWGLKSGPLAQWAWFAPAVLVGAILLYDAWLKHTVAGPVAMGACRFINILLCYAAGSGHGHPPELAWHLAAVIGIYIAGITWFARTEEGLSRASQLVMASTVMAAAIGVAIALPMYLPPATVPVYFVYLLVGYALFVGSALVRAIRVPIPKNVQFAVKRSILGLIVLDAILASAFVGWPGLLLVLLLIPAGRISKLVYST